MKRNHSNQLVFQVLKLSLLMVVLLGSVIPLQASAQAEICSQPDEHVSIPLTDLGSQPYIRMDGQVTPYTGGLYPDGSNQPPAEHLESALRVSAQIEPLDAQGNPDPIDGQIVMISLGMSNTTHEFIRFIELAHENRQIVNPRLQIINGALGGRTADRWIDPQDDSWALVLAELRHRKVTPEQVQVVWVKQTLTMGGDFPEKAQALQANLETIARNLKLYYPNIKIAYFSSRTRSYTYWHGLSPEPNAFETGFSVKWMIEKQMEGDLSLNFDPGRGEVVSPLLLWGPYLWADGGNPRSDGLVWLAEDMERDCTHPTRSGTTKVAGLLFDFFSSDPTARNWFLSEEAAARFASTPAAPATQVPEPAPSRTSAPTSVPTATASLGAEPTSVTEASPTAAAPTASATIEVAPEIAPQQTIAAASPVDLPVQSTNSIGKNLIPFLLVFALIGIGGWIWIRRRI